ncbi:MAG: flagellar protein FlgN [Agathobacter sp.]|nr:flagellar protein FlgN [Agathobacter sp.]MBQ2283851.1 flagellar protein FlgN [Agathobacter sp.]
MASLVEELVSILKEEEHIYKVLLDYGEQKRQILIAGDVPSLEELTGLEQNASDMLLSYSNKQVRVLSDIATVLGKGEEKMTVTRLIGLLETQPEVQKQLTAARDALLDSATKMQRLNQQNEVLIRQAIELAEFDLTLFKSMRQAPETANYDKNAYNTGSILGSTGFDAKQ